MRKIYNSCEEIVNNKFPISLVYDSNWDLNMNNLVRLDIMLTPNEVYDSYILDVYSNLDSLELEEVSHFFNCKATGSLLLSLLELLGEDDISKSWDIKCASLSSGESCLFLDLIIKVNPSLFSFSNTDLYLLFGFAVSDFSFSSIPDSYVVKRAYELHGEYYRK